MTSVVAEKSVFYHIVLLPPALSFLNCLGIKTSVCRSMFLIRSVGSRRLVVHPYSIRGRGLNITMTVNTVTSDPRINARQPYQQQAFSTAQSAEASNNSHYQPRTGKDPEEARVYVLTLLTDPEHHRCMTALRQAYFPRKLNKLESHITLFHALPEEKLEQEIIPELEAMSTRDPYRLQATKAFRLTQGVAIEVADDIDYANKGRGGRGRNMTRIMHAELRKKWSGWLSEQDSKPPRIHYTIMNKVSNSTTVEKCLSEVEGFLNHGSAPKGLMQGKETPNINSSKAGSAGEDEEPLKLIGDVKGLTLWRYEHSGHWVEPRHFMFTKAAARGGNAN